MIMLMKDAADDMERLDKFINRFMLVKGGQVTAEELTEAFSLDTASAIRTLEEAKSVKLYLLQELNDTSSSVRIEDTWHEIKQESENYTVTFIPRKIFFYDGTVLTSDLESLKTGFSFMEQWPFRKRIDSIAYEMQVSYITAFDQATISPSSPEASLEGKKVILKKLDKNQAELMHHTDLDIFRIEGLNTQGQALSQKASWYSAYRDSDQEQLLALTGPLRKLIGQAERDTLIPTEKFRDKYAAKMEALLSTIPEATDTLYRKLQFEGMVKALRLYTVKDRHIRSADIMIRPQSWPDVHLAARDTVSVLTGNDGDTLLETDKALIQINGYYYEDQQYYYHFNPGSKKLEKLLYYSVSGLTDLYVAAREDEHSDYILLDKANKPSGTFRKIEQNEGVITAWRENSILIITPGGEQQWLKDIDGIGEFSNGYAIISKDGRYGFADKNGDMIIPAIYDGAEEFDDMTNYTEQDRLFAVQKGEKWGFVNSRNETVIPFEYESAETFSYGIALVKKDGNLGLITVTNKIVAPFKGGASYGLSTNFGKRSYSLGSGRYNYLGKKEPDED